MRILRASFALTALCLAAPALAQSATPAAPAGTAPAGKLSVTDAEVALFAKTAIAVNNVRTDASIAEADKQKAMAAKIETSGMPIVRFNEIAQASQSDPALQTRIQAAIAAQQKPAL